MQERQERQERRVDPGSPVRVLFEAAPAVDQAIRLISAVRPRGVVHDSALWLQIRFLTRLLTWFLTRLPAWLPHRLSLLRLPLLLPGLCPGCRSAFEQGLLWSRRPCPAACLQKINRINFSR
jgi:hypothetical protein